MFTILPLLSDFVTDDAKFFGNIDAAYESAFNWSVKLDGAGVGVFEFCEGKYNLITEVFA